MWEVAGKQGRGWRIEEICVAEGLEAEICSIRKDELRREMFADWRRKEVSCRPEGVVPCKKVRREEVGS